MPLSGEQAVDVVNNLLQQRWDALKDDHAANSARLRFAGAGFEEIIRDFSVVFRPDEIGGESDLSTLSDGQQSLFYLALVAAVFDVEEHVVTSLPSTLEFTAGANGMAEEEGESDPETPDNSGFRSDQLRIPALTVFALEEPENHLAPHYLGRIIALLRSLTETCRAQALFSSHSPGVLGRIDPEEIRHFRLDMPSRTSIVKKIILPASPEQSSKYVREAVVAYPELYFGKFVILAEGPSEEVVLPKVAAALGLEIDKSFVCVVPLGGGHVNHFWRLLADLSIPYATLLDLDAGREGGGWARIKYACQQLIEIGLAPAQVLEFKHDGQTHQLSREELEKLHNREVDSISDVIPWLRHLEKFNVFFSAPLDFDLAMLHRMPDAYKGIEGQSGPKIPDADSQEWELYIRNAIAASVGGNEAGINLYMKSQPDWKELFPWYRYLFLSRSKPPTHLQALAEVDSGVLQKNAPPSLKRLLIRCKETIAPTTPADG
jgi:putative ATP-dependent endonuclease of OLD family